MEVVLIKYKSPYVKFEETVGIAININVAYEHIQYLKERYPHRYDYNIKNFSFDEYKVIEE